MKKKTAKQEITIRSSAAEYLTYVAASDGKEYETNHYNLQMIIAIGFKVNNERAVQFRKWANKNKINPLIQRQITDFEI